MLIQNKRYNCSFLYFSLQVFTQEMGRYNMTVVLIKSLYNIIMYNNIPILQTFGSQQELCIYKCSFLLHNE